MMRRITEPNANNNIMSDKVKGGSALANTVITDEIAVGAIVAVGVGVVENVGVGVGVGVGVEVGVCDGVGAGVGLAVAVGVGEDVAAFVTLNELLFPV